MQATWLVALAILLCIPAAAGCSIELKDASNDANPAGLPPYYDLQGLNVTALENGTVAWTWEVNGLDTAREVKYYGQFFGPAAEQEIGWHPECIFYTTTNVAPKVECFMLKGIRLPGGAVTFEILGRLNHTIAGNYLQITFSLFDLGLRPGMRFTNSWGVVELTVQVPPSQLGPRASPYTTDLLGPFEFQTCNETASIAPDNHLSSATLTAKQATGVSWLAVIATFAAFAVRRRHKPSK